MRQDLGLIPYQCTEMNKMDLSVYERVSISVYAYMVNLCRLVYVCMYVRARLGTDDWRLATDDW